MPSSNQIKIGELYILGKPRSVILYSESSTCKNHIYLHDHAPFLILKIKNPDVAALRPWHIDVLYHSKNYYILFEDLENFTRFFEKVA